jgi:hypothetical protein
METNEEVTNQEIENEQPIDNQEVENNEAEETQEQGEQGEQQAAETSKTFSQEDLERILEKRLARERETNEQKINELITNIQNFGKPPQQQEEQEQEFDTSQPITFDTLITMQQQAEARAAQDAKKAEYKEMEDKALAAYPKFKEETENHPFTKAVLANKELGDSLEGLDSPFDFMRQGAVHHSEELASILKITDPKKQFAAIVRLDEKIKANNKVPNVSGAPGIVSDDNESSNAASTGNNIQDLRSQVGN